jgi:hypothetical protein
MMSKEDGTYSEVSLFSCLYPALKQHGCYRIHQTLPSLSRSQRPQMMRWTMILLFQMKLVPLSLVSVLFTVFPSIKFMSMSNN